LQPCHFQAMVIVIIKKKHQTLESIFPTVPLILSHCNLDLRRKEFRSPPALVSSGFFVVITLDPIQSEYQARTYLPSRIRTSQCGNSCTLRDVKPSHHLQWWLEAAVQTGEDTAVLCLCGGTPQPRHRSHGAGSHQCNCSSATPTPTVKLRTNSVLGGLLEKNRNLQGCGNIATDSTSPRFEAELFKDIRTYSDPSCSAHQQ